MDLLTKEENPNLNYHNISTKLSQTPNSTNRLL